MLNSVATRALYAVGLVPKNVASSAVPIDRPRAVASARSGWVTGTVAGVCYSLLYLLVLSEEYALLFGALAIFFLLAAIMIGTRKLDWYRVAESHKSPP